MTPEKRYTAALAGNPNVGKSTLFNGLTHLRQHTGNWAGKTVETARGFCRGEHSAWTVVDLPGCYSLRARSAEEAAARDYLLRGGADAVILVCDAGCLERNLILALQTMELSRRVLLCVNLMDEAARRGLRLDLPLLEARLGVPVIGICAQKPESRGRVLAALERLMAAPPQGEQGLARYGERIEAALARLIPLAAGRSETPRGLCLRLLAGEVPPGFEDLAACAMEERAALGLDAEQWEDAITAALVRRAEEICRGAVDGGTRRRDRRIDRVLTGRFLAWPAMLLLLAGVCWLSIAGANRPSRWLSASLFALEPKLACLLRGLGAPPWLCALLTEGAYRSLAWVVAVMLPPMAIFFPLFTVLEDLGYLPRVAFNLDRPFARCHACGKQALTMWLRKNRALPGAAGCDTISIT